MRCNGTRQMKNSYLTEIAILKRSIIILTKIFIKANYIFDGEGEASNFTFKHKHKFCLIVFIVAKSFTSWSLTRSLV